MKAVKIGALSALTASACCLGPAALAAVGLGGLGLGMFFARVSGLLVAAAAALLGLGWWRYLAERRRCVQDQCHMPGRIAALVTLGAASVIVMGFALMHLSPFVNKAACALSCPR